jgi:non-canonical (house-cleaning) NTP pyrophosphatase
MRVCFVGRDPSKLALVERAIELLHLKWSVCFLQHSEPTVVSGDRDITQFTLLLANKGLSYESADVGMAVRSGVHTRSQVGHYYFGPTVVLRTKEYVVTSLGQDMQVPSEHFKNVKSEEGLNRAMFKYLGESGTDLYANLSQGRMEYDEVLVMAFKGAFLDLIGRLRRV